MGLHTGEPIVTDEGYVGIDVHRGARVMSAGHGGRCSSRLARGRSSPTASRSSISARSRRVLLLLDNLEHLLDSAASLGALLAPCEGLQLLVTSRAPLRIAGEREYLLEPLDQDVAVELFLERARSVGRELEADATLDAICRRLDGLPLAIELAAARTKLLNAETLLARLERALPLLTGGGRDVPERQRTLRATIDWSYDLLDEAAQACSPASQSSPGASRSPPPRMCATPTWTRWRRSST
jgi:predicted ATPase